MTQFNYSAMATDQAKDPEVQSYRSTHSNLVLQDIPFGTHGVTLLCDTSTGHQTCSTCHMETSGFRLDSWLVSPLNTYHSETYCLKICLKWYPKASWRLGKGMHSLSEFDKHIKAPLQQFSVPHRCFDHEVKTTMRVAELLKWSLNVFVEL